jgi:hypothetical protein
MTSYFVPSGFTGRAPVHSKARNAARLPWCVLLVVVVLEGTAAFSPHALLVHPVQNSVGFRQLTGYTMVALLASALVFGWLRRLPVVASQHRQLNHFHQLGGLVILLLLASHAAQAPTGFLLLMFHATAVGLGAGALRAVLGPAAAPAVRAFLLATHIGLSFLLGAGVLVHLYLVYAYTA